MVLTAGCEGSIIFWSPNFIQHEYGVSAFVGAWGLITFSIAVAAGRFGAAAGLKLVPLDRLMVTLAFLATLTTLCLVLADDLWVSMISLALTGVSVACFWPGIMTLANERIAMRSARLLGMLAAAGIVGVGTVPFAIGVLADLVQLRVALGLVPLAMASAGLVLLKVSSGS